MKVLFVSELSNLGGGETSLLNTMIELKQRKHDVVPVLLCTEEGKLPERSRQEGIETIIYDFKKKLKSKNPIQEIKSLISLVSFIKLNNIDIVQANEWKSALVFGLLRKIFFLKLKIFWTCHGQWYTFNNYKRYLVNKYIDKIIAVSHSVYENLIKNNIYSSKVIHIPLGININRFEKGNGSKVRKELGIGDREFIVGSIGRFQEIKGQKLIVEAVKLLKDSGAEFKFLMVGDSIFKSDKDNIYKTDVIRMIKEYGLDNIILMGERNDIPDILKAVNALVIPSINESFGMVVVEAFAAGCPVISTPCDGPKEIIKNEELGIILNRRDPVELKNSILDLSKDKERTRGIILAMEKEKEKYSIVNMCEKYVSLYKE